MVTHPAKFSDPIMVELRSIVTERVCARDDTSPKYVLDPFAGVGRIHELYVEGEVVTLGVELEPEWARCHDRTLVGDATSLPDVNDSWTGFFDALITSCTYGNRLADTYDGRDGSRRYTYTIALGRKLSPNNSGSMQWGPAYRELHEKAWTEAMRVVRPDGLIVLNVKNHVRDGKLRHVVEWHLRTLIDMGCYVETVHPISTPGMRHGKNHAARDTERILVLRRP